MPTPTERLRSAIEAEGVLTPKQRKACVRLIEPGLRFETTPMKRMRMGVSRLGGRPDIDASWPGWPVYEGWPMVFVGQLALAEVHALMPGTLPATGMLYFFAHFTPEWGYLFIPGRGESCVLYSKKSPVEQAAWHSGLPEIFRFAPHRLKFRPVATLPESDSVRAAKLEFSLDQEEAYWALTEDVGPDRILGRPKAVQHVVGADWAEAAARPGEHASADGSRVLDWTQAVQRAEDFKHLLSFDMSKVFGELGTSHMYFGIRKRHLKLGRFDETEFVLQGS
jgi:hypothetical protein